MRARRYEERVKKVGVAIERGVASPKGNFDRVATGRERVRGNDDVAVRDREGLIGSDIRMGVAEAPRDFDLVEIPFPERGGPELIREGGLDDKRSEGVIG